MIRIVEALGTALSVAAYVGLVIALIVSWRRTGRRELVISLFGIVLIEASRAVMLFGPGFAVEPGRTTLQLTDDSSLAVFLGNALLMPVGQFIAAIGVVLFAWRNIGRGANATSIH